MSVIRTGEDRRISISIVFPLTSWLLSKALKLCVSCERPEGLWVAGGCQTSCPTYTRTDGNKLLHTQSDSIIQAKHNIILAL